MTIFLAEARLRIAGRWAPFRLRGSRLVRLLRPWLVTLLGVVVALGAYMHPRLGAFPQTEARTVFIAVGSLLGTMIVLSISLSVIPLQRAAEASTSLSITLYVDDPKSLTAPLTLSVLSLLSFSLALLSPAPPWISAALALQVAEIGAGLDLVRFHFRRVAELLDMRSSITIALQGARSRILEVDRRVSRLARLLRSANRRKRSTRASLLVYETAVYAGQQPLHRWLVNQIRHLGETARRAVRSGETYGAIAATQAIEAIVLEYLRVRRTNLRLIPVGPVVMDSDVSVVSSPALEELQQVADSALHSHIEGPATEVIQSLGRLTVMMSNLRSPAFPPHSAPISYQPLGRLVQLLNSAQTKGFDESVFTGVRTLGEVCQKMPPDVALDSVHRAAIEALGVLAFTDLARPSGVITNEAITELLKIGVNLMERRHHQMSTGIKLVLDAVRDAVVAAVALGRDKNVLDLYAPGSAAYDPSRSFSIPQLVVGSLQLVAQAGPKPWISRYRWFLEFNEQVYRHFREVAEKAELGEGFTLALALLALKDILRVYVRVLRDPDLNPTDRRELSNQAVWYTSFCWSAFRNKKFVSLNKAIEATELLAWLGIQAWNSPGIASSMISNIGSIVDSCCERNSISSGYDLADLLMPIEYIRLLAVDRGDKNTARLAKKRFAKPAACKTELWEITKCALRTRRHQLGEKLADPLRDAPLDTAMDVLASVLRKSPEADDPAGGIEVSD